MPAIIQLPSSGYGGSVQLPHASSTVGAPAVYVGEVGGLTRDTLLASIGLQVGLYAGLYVDVGVWSDFVTATTTLGEVIDGLNSTSIGQCIIDLSDGHFRVRTTSEGKSLFIGSNGFDLALGIQLPPPAPTATEAFDTNAAHVRVSLPGVGLDGGSQSVQAFADYVMPQLNGYVIQPKVSGSVPLVIGTMAEAGLADGDDLTITYRRSAVVLWSVSWSVADANSSIYDLYSAFPSASPDIGETLGFSGHGADYSVYPSDSIEVVGAVATKLGVPRFGYAIAYTGGHGSAVLYSHYPNPKSVNDRIDEVAATLDPPLSYLETTLPVGFTHDDITSAGRALSAKPLKPAEEYWTVILPRGRHELFGSMQPVYHARGVKIRGDQSNPYWDTSILSIVSTGGNDYAVTIDCSQKPQYWNQYEDNPEEVDLTGRHLCLGVPYEGVSGLEGYWPVASIDGDEITITVTSRTTPAPELVGAEYFVRVYGTELVLNNYGSFGVYASAGLVLETMGMIVTGAWSALSANAPGGLLEVYDCAIHGGGGGYPSTAAVFARMGSTIALDSVTISASISEAIEAQSGGSVSMQSVTLSGCETGVKTVRGGRAFTAFGAIIGCDDASVGSDVFLAAETVLINVN